MHLKWIADHFKESQLSIFALFVLVGIFTYRNKIVEKSAFKVREADTDTANRLRQKQGPDTANAKLSKFQEKPKPPPLALPGIQLHGKAHEILGIAEDANELEVMRAFKESMKRYHPDVIQNVAPDQMKFYQDAATQINAAKNEMLAKLKKN